ncbi:hypothetical protein [Lentibacillus salinarum]|uniref:Uncharacterized protein n=1 Tax=Lentibacillus salinarum TaxID=446820 RepID=A0ABW3ZXL4_9BACI
MHFIQDKIVDTNLQRLRKSLINHSRIKYISEIYFHGERAYLYSSFYDGEQRVIVVDKNDRFFVSTGKGNPNYYLEITAVVQ